MFVIVLTGGLGSGKSTTSTFFRGRGAVVVDLDRVADDVLMPGTPVLARVVDAFGPGVLSGDGALDRQALADAAFVSAEATAKLDSIVHPAVAREVGESLSNLRLMPNQADTVVLEVPLLVEAPVLAELGDLVLAISAPERIRLARAVAAGMAEEDARRRLAVQASDDDRAQLADEVIENAGTIDEFMAALEDFWVRRVPVAKRGAGR